MIIVKQLKFLIKDFVAQKWSVNSLYKLILVDCVGSYKLLEYVPGTNQYLAINVKFLAQGNNGLPLTGFEPTWSAILIITSAILRLFPIC
jgi:hypothetical protein